MTDVYYWVADGGDSSAGGGGAGVERVQLARKLSGAGSGDVGRGDAPLFMSALFTASSPLLLSSTNLLAGTVESLLLCMDARDATLRSHCERVADFADAIAATLGLSPEQRHTLALGALLHDIGNIGVPDAILLKPTGLSPEEFAEMRLHPQLGEAICAPIAELAPALPLIRSHHEKLDGSGYPDALSGAQLSLAVRILSVTDVYDTLRCERAYREAFSHEEAMEILEDEARRGWWDADIVARLCAIPGDDDLPLV